MSYVNNLEKQDYYERVEVYLNEEEAFLVGEIYINEDSYCEGIVVDTNNNSCFVFGIFQKFNCLDLYVVISNEEVYRYRGKKVPFRYEGDYSLINGSNVNSFYLKNSGLDVDPRDYWDEDTPKEQFIKKLKTFKENWLSDENNNALYTSLVSTSNDEKATHL